MLKKMQNIGIVGTGVATLDIYINQRRMYPGGNEYNVIVNARKLGARAAFMGVYGNDPAGKILEQTLKMQGVDTSMSRHEIGSSGYSLVELKDDGDRVFLEWNRHGVADLYPFTFTEEELQFIRTFDVMCLGKLSSVPIERVIYLSKQRVDISYDFNSFFTEEEVEEVAPFVKYAFFSCSHLTEEEIHALLKKTVNLGCSIAIATRGADPVIAYDGTEFYTQKTCKVEVFDALGAGDSYIAAFLYNYLELLKEGVTMHDRVQTALKKATEYSAQVIQIEGSIGIGYDLLSDKISEIVNVPEHNRDVATEENFNK